MFLNKIEENFFTKKFRNYLYASIKINCLTTKSFKMKFNDFIRIFSGSSIQDLIISRNFNMGLKIKRITTMQAVYSNGNVHFNFDFIKI